MRCIRGIDRWMRMWFRRSRTGQCMCGREFWAVMGCRQKVVACKLKIMRDGENIRTQQMTDVGAAGNGRFEATIADLPEGEYQLQVDAGNGAASPTLTLRVQRSAEAEMADLSGDETVLRPIGAILGRRVSSVRSGRYAAEKIDGRSG